MTLSFLAWRWSRVRSPKRGSTVRACRSTMPANGARPLPACAAWAGLKPGCRHLKKIDVPPLEHKTMTTAKSFDICEILKLLPHRYPFLLVDRVLLIDEESMKLKIGRAHV